MELEDHIAILTKVVQRMVNESGDPVGFDARTWLVCWRRFKIEPKKWLSFRSASTPTTNTALQTRHDSPLRSHRHRPDDFQHRDAARLFLFQMAQGMRARGQERTFLSAVCCACDGQGSKLFTELLLAQPVVPLLPLTNHPCINDPAQCQAH